ncbi:MAG: polyprenyl synthetase family protein [Prevotella sp.]|nr:polyprenyl synthetase family protein [Prevotella sp.]
MTSNEILQLVNDHLRTVGKDHEPATLYEPIQYVLTLGGKRIRPMLMMLSYNLFREHPERIISAATALETYHNFTLLHDDLMDNADMRRGQPTVHKRWDANTAILSGDAMIILAYKGMCECEPDKQKEVLDLFNQTSLEIMIGQQYDMDFERRMDVAEEEYIEMIRLKTSVLLACAMKMGAILADAPEDDQQRLYKCGERLGLAFQLQDDFLDVYGDPKVFGKNIGGDILSNKKTYMLINAFNLADERQREELTRWVECTDFNPQEKIAAVTRLYDEIGVAAMAQKRIKAYFTECRRYLDEVQLPEEKKQPLIDYINGMMEREY